MREHGLNRVGERPILEDLSAKSLSKAIERSVWDAFTFLGTLNEQGAEYCSGVLRVRTGISQALTNGIRRTQLCKKNLAKRVRKEKEHFACAGIPMSWWVGPSDTPENLRTELVRNGFILEADMPGMAIDLRRMNDGIRNPQGFEIRQVDNLRLSKRFAEVAWIGSEFPMPVEKSFVELDARAGFYRDSCYRRFAGFADDRLVSTSVLFLCNGVAGIYTVATLPEARGKGFGTAVTMAALQSARDSGYRVAVLQSSHEGEKIYRRIGFKKYCTVGLYA